MRRREERTVKNAAGKSTAKVAEVNGADETVNPLDFQCTKCDLYIKAEKELNIHMKDKHTIPNLSTPEKERLPDKTGDLKLTPVHGERSEEVASLPSPTPDAFNCDDCNIQFPDWCKLKAYLIFVLFYPQTQFLVSTFLHAKAHKSRQNRFCDKTA